MSEVAIANRALVKLGADTIIALDDSNKRARTMNVSYAPVRDAELRRRRWRFSIKRASLPALATAPISQFPYQYQIPEDCLRVLNVGEWHPGGNLSDYNTASDSLYSLEHYHISDSEQGTAILTHLPAPLKIRYIARITDPDLFDSSFAEAFASRLAYECCEAITQSDSKKQLAMADYRMAIKEAIAANLLEVAPESQADNSWVTARL